MDFSVDSVESAAAAATEAGTLEVGMLGAGGGVGGGTGAGDGALLTDEGGDDDDSAAELLSNGTGVDECCGTGCSIAPGGGATCWGPLGT